VSINQYQSFVLWKSVGSFSPAANRALIRTSRWPDWVGKRFSFLCTTRLAQSVCSSPRPAAYR